MPGGLEAMQLRVAEQYITQFGDLAKKTNTLILPANVADVGSMVALAMKVFSSEAAGLRLPCLRGPRPATTPTASSPAKPLPGVGGLLR